MDKSEMKDYAGMGYEFLGKVTRSHIANKEEILNLCHVPGTYTWTTNGHVAMDTCFELDMRQNILEIFRREWWHSRVWKGLSRHGGLNGINGCT